MLRRYEFQLWFDARVAERILAEAILDAQGRPISSRPVFEKEGKGGHVCIRGYQGFAQHSPYIQEFAQRNAENFAQVLLFAPLTANTKFSRFNEWFPVLMDFLRKRNRVSVDEVGNFVAGVGGQRIASKMAPDFKGGLLAGVIDLGEGNKSELISHVWNNRETLYKRFMELADRGEFGQILKELVPITGIGTVKAGFVVQMIFGQLGCMDTHNITIYSAMANMMAKNRNLDPQLRNKWAELGRMIKGAEKGGYWGIKDKSREGATEKVADAYLEVLAHMKDELGIDPGVMWNIWVNFVGQRYANDPDPTNRYSAYQGLAFSPKDKQLRPIFGAHPEVQYHGLTANVVEPHKTSGAVSRVHLVSAMTPDEILKAVESQLGNKYHVINAALRADPLGMPALQALSDRIRDATELDLILMSGALIRPAQQAAKAHNKQIMEQLVENSKKALWYVLTKKYRLPSREATSLVEMYTGTLKSLYTRHMSEIVRTLRSQATRQARLAGTYISSDEEMGYDKDIFDPSKPFDPKQPGHKIARLMSGPGEEGEEGTGYADPYVDQMREVNRLRLEYEAQVRRQGRSIERAKGRLSDAKTLQGRLNRMLSGRQEKVKSLPEDSRQARELNQEIRQINRKLPRVDQRVADLEKELLAAQEPVSQAYASWRLAEKELKGRAGGEMEEKKAVLRGRLHKTLATPTT